MCLYFFVVETIVRINRSELRRLLSCVNAIIMFNIDSLHSKTGCEAKNVNGAKRGHEVRMKL